MIDDNPLAAPLINCLRELVAVKRQHSLAIAERDEALELLGGYRTVVSVQSEMLHDLDRKLTASRRAFQASRDEWRRQRSIGAAA
jgi:predicted nucleic acid-binding protein